MFIWKKFNVDEIDGRSNIKERNLLREVKKIFALKEFVTINSTKALLTLDIIEIAKMTVATDKLVYDISPAKRDTFKPVDQFLLFIKMMYPFWGENLRQFIRGYSHLWRYLTTGMYWH